VQLAKELAAELLERLEQAVGSAAFIGAYSEVQRRVQSSKAEKRRQFAAEAIAEPQQYAQRKVRALDADKFRWSTFPSWKFSIASTSVYYC
jgi:ubiquinone biosynthesis protein UbiJ